MFETAGKAQRQGRKVTAGAMGGAQVQSLTPTPPKHFRPVKGGGGAGTKNTNRYLVPRLSFQGGIFTNAEKKLSILSINTWGDRFSQPLYTGHQNFRRLRRQPISPFWLV